MGPAFQSIPAFLSIDVEPDEFQVSRHDDRPWAGYEVVYEFLRAFRDELARVSGVVPRFGWYFRMDPQIRDICGRADAAISDFTDRRDTLARHSDYFGVHAHPLRWSEKDQVWVHDFGDASWLRECTEFSLDAFEECTGAKTQLYRAGAGFLSNDIIDVLDARGVPIEMSLEPVSSWGLTAEIVPTATDSSPIVGKFVDCQNAPQTPYRPERADFRRAGGKDARQILLVPMTTGPRTLPTQEWMSTMEAAPGPRLPDAPVIMLYPTLDWPSERYFWDLVAYQLRGMRNPYLSLAIRTDSPASALMTKLLRLLAELPRHPIAERLTFVDPLSARRQIALESD
jgi:hypothetical protein